MAEKYIKYRSQNIVDFVITNYGSFDKVFDFMEEAGYTSYNDFLNDNADTLYLQPPVNNVTTIYENTSNVVSSIDVSNFAPTLICNNDLVPKTIIIGDFNGDFNDDFDITSLTTVEVGYEGMTLYLRWSVTNTGNQKGTATGTLQLTGFADRPFSVDISPNETHVFNEQYDDLQAGTFIATILGDCPQTLTFDVLGNSNFVCNDDFLIVGGIPVPPIGADIMFWYGESGYANYNIINGDSVKHIFTQGDTLDITRLDSSGGVSQLTIQSDIVYPGDSGKNLHIKYEVTDILTGTITSMHSLLSVAGGGSSDTSAQILITSFDTDGEHLVVSSGQTSGTNLYSNTVELLSSSAEFTIKISEIYYL